MLLLEFLASAIRVIVGRGSHPWVRVDLLDRGTIITIEREELEHKVFERTAEAMSIGLRPVLIIILALEKRVEVLLLACLLEWEDTLH